MKSWFAAKFTFLIILLFGTSDLTAQKRSVSLGNPSPSDIGIYEPKSFKSLNALPLSVKLTVEKHLRDRFGDQYYSKLILASCAKIDFDELYRVNPDAKYYRWKIPAYELVFKYADRKKGIKEYYARIRLDSYGDPIDEINLPNVSVNPHKADVISIKKAIEIAKERGFKAKEMNIRISYDSHVESLVWEISSFAGKIDYIISTRILRIDTHSAEILEDGYRGAIE